jgi:hypothetical protein
MQLYLNRVTDFHAIFSNEWLLRSMGQPLAIFVTWDGQPIFESACTAMISIMARYSHQWQEIELQLPDFCYDVLECVHNHLPILLFISIHRAMEEFEPMRMFNTAPQLRATQVDGWNLNKIELSVDVTVYRLQ